MSARSLHKIVAVLLVLALIVPTTLFVAPPRAQAGWPVIDVGNLIKNTITSHQSLLTKISSATSAVANVAQKYYTYVLQPMAFALSGNMLKLMTASTISFVTGGSNGTGRPQYVQDVRTHLQTVGDIQASAFLLQLSKHSNSPFTAAIKSSLHTTYYRDTSSAGFFDANRSTLDKASPNVNAYLAGDWSKGGVAMWFELTTQPQNNPYMLYQASERQLNTLVSNAQSARAAELDQNQGFLSWCKPDAVKNADRDTCTNKDGTSSPAQTPGSTIKASLDKALGLQADKLVTMGGGNVGKEINGILKNLSTVMQTINFGSQILGSGSGGLASVGNSSATGQSRLGEFESGAGFLGVDQDQIQNSAATTLANEEAIATAQEQLAEYDANWSIIADMANEAGAAIKSVMRSCLPENTPLGTPVQISCSGGIFCNRQILVYNAAVHLFATEISPLRAQVNAATTTVAKKQRLINQLQKESSAGSDTYAADLATLVTLPPSSDEMLYVRQNVQNTGEAYDNPDRVDKYVGALNVVGGTIMDRLILINTNAATVKEKICD